jgi:hypothetical protein
MEITMTEFALFTWALVATLWWQQARHDLKVHRMMTGEIFMRIAKGKIKVVEHDDSFEFKEV